MVRGGSCTAVVGAMLKERMIWRRGRWMLLERDWMMEERNMTGDSWWDGLVTRE